MPRFEHFDRGGILGKALGAAAALASRYHRVTLAGSAVFVLLIVLTVWGGWTREYEAELSLAEQRVRVETIRLKGIVKGAQDHVGEMASWANDFPYRGPYSCASDIWLAAQQGMAAADADNFNLDLLASRPPEQRPGLMVAIPETAQPHPGGKPSNLDLGLSLLERFRYGQRTIPFLRWSYFFSARKDMLVMAPWAPTSEVLGEEPNARAFLQHSWAYEITDRGQPANNPGRSTYWTKAYPDQAGAGLMVSYGQPVYWGDEFIGVIGADLLLTFLSDFLHEFPDQDGVLAIANEHGELLADRADTVGRSKEVQSIDAILPKTVGPWSSLVGKADGRLVGGWHIIADGVGDPRWTLVYLLPRSQLIERVAKRFAPQLLLSALLVAALFAMNRFLRRAYVDPALGIAEFVTREDCLADPKVPDGWRQPVESMVRAFRERGLYLADLRRANEDLELKVAQRTRELTEANSRLEELATTDPLTGAFNRRRLLDSVENERQRAMRGVTTISMAVFDVDHFKQINDTHGHSVGDEVLRALVSRVNDCIRVTDSVYRYGGEEFVVLLPMLDAQGAGASAERLRKAVEEKPILAEGVCIPVTISIGVASFVEGETAERFFARADEMLYAAKRAGRNRVMVAPRGGDQ